MIIPALPRMLLTGTAPDASYRHRPWMLLTCTGPAFFDRMGTNLYNIYG